MHRNGSQILGDGFIPRMNKRSRSGIMLALGPSDLFSQDTPSIHSVIVDARLTLDDHDVSTELRDHDISMIIDTQAWRYSDPRTWETDWSATPYAPTSPFIAQRDWIREYVRSDLAAQFSMGARCFLLPGWYPSLESVECAREVAMWTLEAYEELGYKTDTTSAIAWLPARPGRADAILAAARVYAESGMISAAYVQRQNIDGLRDPLDRLKHCAKLMLRVEGLGLPVIAGHLGCVGVTFRAIGVSAADCGPCEGQSFDFSEAIRTARPRTSKNGSSYGFPVRMWLDEVGRVVTAKQMETIRQNRVAFAEVMCRRACHRFRLGEDSTSVAVHHSLLSLCEASTRQSTVPASMRIDDARRLLMAMKTRIGIMNSALGEESLLRQDHLDTQLALLTGAESLHGAA
jgi:hypothetical protein